MDFGRVHDSELRKVKFKLPAEPEINKTILKGRPVKSPKIYIGCAKWGRQEWLGKVYPVKTSEKNFLDNYVEHYNSIELNATHYKIYDSNFISKWAEKAKDKDFRFCPKMYKGITHFGNLTGKERMTTDFLAGLLAFKKNLGPVFIQLGENFSPKRRDELLTFLTSLPTDMQFFLEVRHKEWLADAAIANDLFQQLKKLKIGAVITDTAGRRDCAHMICTVPKAFIRFVGNSLHDTDYTRIDDWVKRIAYWIESGLQELYFFMHMHDEAFSPELTVYLVDALTKKCNLRLQKPGFVTSL